MNKILKEFKDKIKPEVEDHLTCGNENCFYDGKWCYHLTDKEFDEWFKDDVKTFKKEDLIKLADDEIKEWQEFKKNVKRINTI